MWFQKFKIPEIIKYMSDIVTIIARSFSLSELTKIIGEDFASSLPEDTRMTNRTLLKCI